MTNLNSLCIAGLTNLDDNSAEKCLGGAFAIALVSANGQTTRKRFGGQNSTANVNVPKGTTAIRLRNRDNGVADFRYSFTGKNGLSDYGEVATLLQGEGMKLSNGTGTDFSFQGGKKFPISKVKVSQF